MREACGKTAYSAISVRAISTGVGLSTTDSEHLPVGLSAIEERTASPHRYPPANSHCERCCESRRWVFEGSRCLKPRIPSSRTRLSPDRPVKDLVSDPRLLSR